MYMYYQLVPSCTGSEAVVTHALLLYELHVTDYYIIVPYNSNALYFIARLNLCNSLTLPLCSCGHITYWYVLLHSSKPRANTVQITLLAVRKKYRRMGIGRYLMQV